MLFGKVRGEEKNRSTTSRGDLFEKALRRDGKVSHREELFVTINQGPDSVNLPRGMVLPQVALIPNEKPQIPRLRSG